MEHDNIVFAIFVIFFGAAVLATAALFARQALIVAYIALGVLVGPSGLELVPDTELVQQISEIGIIFLLFMLGIDLQPQDLIHMLKKATIVTAVSSLIFASVGFAVAIGAGFASHEALIVGAAMMFSSTILGLKLLPTTVLHHQHMGEVIIAILLLQDLMAIGVLLFLEGYAAGGTGASDVIRILLAIPVLGGAAFVFGKYVLLRLFMRFDTIKEYIFLVTIGWCLGMAELAGAFGLSHEIGAFVAGVTLASSPISEFIAENLKPLRDFFLVIFFFTLGARFDLGVLGDIWLPSILLAGGMLVLKPYVFMRMFRRTAERPRTSLETGVRLGQISEFSLLVAVLAATSGFISMKASYLIQTATLLSFVVSSYYIVRKYPTPIATDDALRRD